MQLRISISPIADCILRQLYKDSIGFKLGDSLSLFIFSQFRRPHGKEFNREDPEGVKLIVPDQMVHDGRIYFSDESKRLTHQMVKNRMYEELLKDITLHLQDKKQQRLAILAFMERFNLTEVVDYETLKKYITRKRKNLEKSSGSFVPECPTLSDSVPKRRKTA